MQRRKGLESALHSYDAHDAQMQEILHHSYCMQLWERSDYSKFQSNVQNNFKHEMNQHLKGNSLLLSLVGFFL